MYRLTSNQFTMPFAINSAQSTSMCMFVFLYTLFGCMKSKQKIYVPLWFLNPSTRIVEKTIQLYKNVVHFDELFDVKRGFLFSSYTVVRKMGMDAGRKYTFSLSDDEEYRYEIYNKSKGKFSMPEKIYIVSRILFEERDDIYSRRFIMLTMPGRKEYSIGSFSETFKKELHFSEADILAGMSDNQKDMMEAFEFVITHDDDYSENGKQSFEDFLEEMVAKCSKKHTKSC